MKKICLKMSIFLDRHPIIYWILQLTWGLLWNVIGLFIAAGALLIGGKPSIFHRCIAIKVGKNWGGLECGFFFLYAGNMSDDYTEHTKRHEAGHNFQNAILGPLFPFLVAIPSAIRYWYQVWRSSKGLTNKPYDSIWFEGSATEIGGTLYLKGERK